jgi:hypothetical protein
MAKSNAAQATAARIAGLRASAHDRRKATERLLAKMPLEIDAIRAGMADVADRERRMVLLEEMRQQELADLQRKERETRAALEIMEQRMARLDRMGTGSVCAASTRA